jgi:hypothetical protein
VLHSFLPVGRFGLFLFPAARAAAVACGGPNLPLTTQVPAQCELVHTCAKNPGGRGAGPAAVAGALGRGRDGHAVRNFLRNLTRTGEDTAFRWPHADHT